MVKIFNIIIMTLMLTTANVAHSQLIAPSVISQIQSKFNGRVVGVHNDGPTTSVQVLLRDGRVIIVTVDNASNRIIDVQK